MDRAEEVQAKLPAEHPSFVKRMLQSHVVRGFWLVSCHRLDGYYLFECLINSKDLVIASL